MSQYNFNIFYNVIYLLNNYKIKFEEQDKIFYILSLQNNIKSPFCFLN